MAHLTHDNTRSAVSHNATQDARATIRHQLEKDPEYRRRASIKYILSRQPEPRSTDPDRSQELRYLSATVLLRISKLQTAQERLAPVVNPRLESALLQLRTERDLVYWRIFRINDLPPEILANIFRYVVWSTNNPDLGVKYRLWLTWVCRRWRFAAIADFTLWNAIWFRDGPPYTRSMTWFDRAGTAPLDIRINERDDSWNHNEDEHRFTPEQMAQLLDKLFTKLSTIRMLIVVVDTWPPALVVLNKLEEYGGPSRVVNMERFELHRAGTPYVWLGAGYQPDAHRYPITLFGGASAPSLKFLGLNGVHINWYDSPMTNLTTLDLRRLALGDSPRLERFREILHTCPNLHKLALDGAGPTWDGIDRVVLDPIELPRLMVLVLGDFSVGYATHILSQFSAPNVRDLTMMNLGGEDYSPLIETMTSRFKEVRLLTIYTLELSNSPPSRQILVNFLESLSLLSYLRIAQIQRHLLAAFLEDPRHHAITLSRDVSSSSRQPLCMNLAVLEFQSVDMETILEFGRGRRTLGYPLRKIYVNGPWVSSITPEEQIDLRNICDSLYVAPLGSSTPEEAEIYL